MLNGFGYTMFNIPSRDLETTWREVLDLSVQQAGAAPSPLATDKINAEAALVSKEISSRRFAKTRLYTGGRILHIIRRKKTEMEKCERTLKINFQFQLFFFYLGKPKPVGRLTRCAGASRKSSRSSK